MLSAGHRHMWSRMWRSCTGRVSGTLHMDVHVCFRMVRSLAKKTFIATNSTFDSPKQRKQQQEKWQHKTNQTDHAPLACGAVPVHTFALSPEVQLATHPHGINYHLSRSVFRDAWLHQVEHLGQHDLERKSSFLLRHALRFERRALHRRPRLAGATQEPPR